MLRNRNWVQLYGNHDFYTKNAYGLKEEVKVDRMIYTMHGHQFDKFNKTGAKGFMSKLGLIGANIWGVVETVFGVKRTHKWLPKLEDWAREKFMQNKESAQNLPDENYIKDSTEYAKKKKAKIMVMGHTHKPKLVKVGNQIYANSGSWTDDQANAILIDTVKRSIRLYDFITGKAKLVQSLKY